MPVQVAGYTRVVNGRTITVRGFSRDGNDAAHRAAGTLDRPQIAARVGNYAQGATPEGTYGGGRHAPGVFPDLRLAQQTYQPTAEQAAFGLGLSGPAVALSAADDWAHASAEAIAHVRLVLANNPKKTLAQVLARPDVQEALADAGRQGAAATVAAIDAAWSRNGGPPASRALDRLRSDAVLNGARFRRRMSAALAAADRAALETELRRYSLRSLAGEAVAATRARTEAFLAALAPGTPVEWEARHDPATDLPLGDVCPGCAALHRTVVLAGQEFDRTAGGLLVSPYFLLVGPPRHPGCRCRLVARPGGTTT